MARKQKIDTRMQPGLFDFLEGTGADAPRDTSIPGVEEFIVETLRKQGAGETPAPMAPPVPSAEATPDYNPLDEPMKVDSTPRGAILFRSFGSGSSGNCAFVGTRSGGILIDAGVRAETVIAGLEKMDMTMNDIHGILLTHDHSDHVSCVYSLVRRHNHIRVFCTPKTFGGIMRRHSISRRLKDYHQPIYKEFPFSIGPLNIVAFDVSHDGTDNCGYHITCGGLSLCVATDLGCITDRVDHYMRQSDFIVIESNYDAEMLRNGRYPAYLKARIAAANGHLDNAVTAAYLKEIRTDRLRNVFLCHLSADNNTPSLALSTVAGALGVTPGIKMPDGSLRVSVLPRYDISGLYILK